MNQRSAGQSALPDSAQSSSFSHNKKKYFPYTVHIQYRVGQNISNFQRFHTVIRQAHLYLKVPKLANFRRSLAEIEWCANFLALRSDKNKQDRESNFLQWGLCVQVLQNITAQHPLKKYCFWTLHLYCTYFLLICQKDIWKIKNKGYSRYEISTIKVVL